ncbi:hypothetical protein D3C85_1493690 [compost metagenome]
MGQAAGALSEGPGPGVVDLQRDLGKQAPQLGQYARYLAFQKSSAGMGGGRILILAADDQSPVVARAHVEVGV